MDKLIFVLITGIGGSCFTSIVLSSSFYTYKIKPILQDFYKFNCDICIAFLINVIWNLVFMFSKVSFVYIISLSPIFSLLTVGIIYVLNKLDGGEND